MKVASRNNLEKSAILRVMFKHLFTFLNSALVNMNWNYPSKITKIKKKSLSQVSTSLLNEDTDMKEKKNVNWTDTS